MFKCLNGPYLPSILLKTTCMKIKMNWYRLICLLLPLNRDILISTQRDGVFSMPKCKAPKSGISFLSDHTPGKKSSVNYLEIVKFDRSSLYNVNFDIITLLKNKIWFCLSYLTYPSYIRCMMYLIDNIMCVTYYNSDLII
jgi:hypothetical protein